MTLPELVKYILNKEEDVKLAEVLLERIKKGNFVSSSHDREAIYKKDSRFTEDRYYKVLKILQDINMVKKERRLYLLDYSIVSNLTNEWLEMVFGEMI